MRRLGSGERWVLGIMSGTSLDGIDVALARVSNRGATLERFAALPFPADVRRLVLPLAEQRVTSTAEISQVNFLLGEVFAEAALAACRKFRLHPSRLALIASHGQTVFHQGTRSRLCGHQVASTLQLGEPSVIAARTGVLTIGDFRPADIAAGGQGAPLVPFADYLLYRHDKLARAALNIGGIANVTVIPRAAKLEQVFAFDTGPGNMVIDALVRHYTQGRSSFDRDAEMARHGKLLPLLLKTLLSDRYFKQRPPKTTGRERYGERYVRMLLAHPQARRARPEDVVHTATHLTALTIVDGFRRLVLPRCAVAELIVSGGGSHNPLLLAQIRAGLDAVRVRTSGELGVSEDAKEAFAFAVLGFQTLNRRPGNVPAATGAKRPAVLGKVCYP